MSFLYNPAQAVIENRIELSAGSNKVAEDEAKAKVLIERLFEIRDMDITKLSESDKSSLKKEVRSIRDQLQMISGGIYISFGLIIIILLLIIIL